MSVESLFVLSEPWEVTTLGDVCRRGGGNVQTGPFGSQLHASDYVPIGIPSIMPQNIGDNRINEEGIARITPEDAKRLSKYLVKIGDIVYSRRGDVERRSLVREHENGWLCGTGCLRVSFGKKSVVHPPYAAYYLGHPMVREWIVRHAQGATMLNLNTSILSALPFVLPPFAEQERIAGILADLDDKIELNRQINQTLEQIAQAIFKSWFVDFEPVKAKIEAKAAGRNPERAAMCAISGKLELELDQLSPEQHQQLAATAALFPDELVESELGLIPEGWEVIKLADMVQLTGGGTPKRSNPEYWGGEIPWFSVHDAPGDGDVFVLETKETISQLGLKKSSTRLLPIGTTIISSRGTVGRLALAGVEMAMNQSCYGVMGADGIGPYFNYFNLKDAVRTLKQNTHGAVFDTITRQTFETVTCVKSAKPVLKGFETTLAPFMDLMRSNIDERRTLATLRDNLLPKLLSGDASAVGNNFLLGGQVKAV